MHIVLIGNTGSGKSTLARLLHDRFDLPVISSGEIARELSESDPATDLALKQGSMAPEQAMRSMVRSRIEAADLERGGWILDGFPRTVEQLICLSYWSAAMPTYFYLDVPVWTCLERLVARRRPDDNPDAIARKLESFDLKTHPMLSILDDGGLLHHLSGEEEPVNIRIQVEEVLS